MWNKRNFRRNVLFVTVDKSFRYREEERNEKVKIKREIEEKRK